MAGRRAAGEGTITKRPNGTWSAAISLPGGKRRWFYAPTRAEALRKLQAAIAARNRGEILATDRQTLDQWLTRWVEQRKPELSPATYVAYEGRLRRHIRPALGDKRLIDLKPADLRDFYAKLSGAGLAPKTVQGVHLVIYGGLQKAMEDEILFRNVAALATPPKRAAPKPTYYNTDQARRFLEAIAGDPHEALYVTTIETGLRLGEISGLRWSDLDFDNELLHVRQQRRRDYHGWAMAPPKSRKSRRTVALGADLIAYLRQHRRDQDAARAELGDAWRDNDLVFPQPNGAPLHPHNFRVYVYYALLDRLGLPRLKFHGLRHTFASLHISRGTPIALISEMMGHSSIAITKDIYGHVEIEAQREAVRGLSARLRPKNGPNRKP